jgi:hypothetical protein
MKAQLVMLCLGVMLTLTTYGGINYNTFADSGCLPEGSAVGSSGTATSSGYLSSVSNSSLKLNSNGGYNGDLYACLSHSGVLLPLLNRVGESSGDAGAGFNVAQSWAAAPDIRAYGSHTPNGTWTLFIADLSSGGVSPLASLELDLTPVPEPVNVALGIFAGVFLVVILARSQRVRNRVQRWRVAVVQWINAV